VKCLIVFHIHLPLFPLLLNGAETAVIFEEPFLPYLVLYFCESLYRDAYLFYFGLVLFWFCLFVCFFFLLFPPFCTIFICRYIRQIVHWTELNFNFVTDLLRLFCLLFVFIAPLVFSVTRVTRSLVLCVCFVDRCLSFCTFSFEHCVVCSSSIYPFGIFKLFLLKTTLPLIFETDTGWDIKHVSNLEQLLPLA